MTIAFDRPALPVLADCDVAVIGGSFGGVAAALHLADAGRRVVLVESRTYLGREITATLRPWLRLPQPDGTPAIPELIDTIISAAGYGPQGPAREIPLRMDAVKVALEDAVLAAGIKLVYASLPVGVLRRDDQIRGVILGDKSGRQVIRCRTLIDATATALVVRLAGASFETAGEAPLIYAATLEFTDVGPLDVDRITVDARLGVIDDRVEVHRGYRAADHVLVSYRQHLPPAADPIEAAAQSVQARRRGVDLATYLVDHVPGFASAVLATSSYELDGPHTTPMTGEAPAWTRDLAPVPQGSVASMTRSIAPADFAGPLSGLWSLNEGARLTWPERARLRDPVGAAQIGTWLAALIAAVPAPPLAPKGDASVRVSPDEPLPPRRGLVVSEQTQPQQGRDYPWQDVSPSPIPVLRTVDVLIAGGGTSGAVAGIVAAREGVRTAIVDMNPGLGGTGTYGGIHTYWFGQRTGFVSRILDWVGDVHDRLHLPRPEGNLAQWNIEAKGWALAEQAEAAGVEVFLNTPIIATLVDGRAVRGVVAATRWGPVALTARVVIDGTGDGDVAAFAGAAHVYGSDREHAVMYAYLPQVATPGRPRNVKTSMLDTTNVEDATRLLLAERRRGDPGDHDHGVYIGPRESRHIRGDVTVSFTDQLRLRSYPDVAYIAFANHDMKGESTSDWIRMGLQAPNIEIEIPYRALLPRGLDSILVVGKAYGATHDALGAPRMMPDLENLGGVAGIAAGMAVTGGTAPRDVDVAALQQRLVHEGVLPARILTRTLVPVSYADDELAAMIETLDPDRPLQTYSDAEVGQRQMGRIALVDLLCAGPRVVPLLEDALARAAESGDGAREVLLGQLLAVLGSRAGVPTLITAMVGHLSGNSLPPRTVAVRHAGRHPPDQGSAPTAANLLYCLGLTQDPRVLQIWNRVAELVATTEAAAFLDPVEAAYYYVAYLAYGAERLGDPRAIGILQRLHSHPSLHSQALRRGFQADYLPERLAYLELLIGRALARCGSPEGILILAHYLDDVRALLAEHAHSELIDITGQDFGKNPIAWSAWLEEAGDALEPTPWTGPTDPVAAWDDVILVEA